MDTSEYEAKINHDGQLHEFTIPKLEQPICQACGERVFTEKTDDQINDALRSHLKLLTPAQIIEALQRLGQSSEQVALRLGVAEETLQRWIEGFEIQSRAMDNLLRAYFALPQLRAVLSADAQDPLFGLGDMS